VEKALKTILSAYPVGRREVLIPILQDVQDSYGYLPEDTIGDIAMHLQIPTSKVYSVATFYNQFAMKPRGRFHILCCDGGTCHMEDSSGLRSELGRLLELKNGDTTVDGMFSMEVVPCLGLCHIAPALIINGEIYGKLHRSGMAEFIEKIKTGNNV
jgi:iron-hydrogenase subunit gamma